MSLIGICNPLLDLSAEVSHDLLAKYDLKPSNAILAEEKHLPLYPELINNHNVQYIAGGAGQNAIRAAQWLLQTPNSTVYFGCIGKDAMGAKLREEATNDGVNVHYLEDESTPTGTCAVLVTDKERSLVANLAAANQYKKSHFDSPEIQALVNNAQYFYITGFFLTVSPETMIAVGEHCLQHNKTFLLNISAPFLIDFFYDKLSAVLPYVDVLFGNEHEYEAFGKKLGLELNFNVIAKAISELPKKNDQKPRVVVVTRGSHSTVVYNPRDEAHLTEIPVPPVPSEEIVDVNGAGDSFVGGFLARYIQNRPLSECVAAGHYVAGVTIRTSGTVFRGKVPQFSYP